MYIWKAKEKKYFYLIQQFKNSCTTVFLSPHEQLSSSILLSFTESPENGLKSPFSYDESEHTWHHPCLPLVPVGKPERRDRKSLEESEIMTVAIKQMRVRTIQACLSRTFTGPCSSPVASGSNMVALLMALLMVLVSNWGHAAWALQCLSILPFSHYVSISTLPCKCTKGRQKKRNLMVFVVFWGGFLP